MILLIAKRYSSESYKLDTILAYPESRIQKIQDPEFFLGRGR